MDENLDESSVTLVEVLEQQKQMEEESAAVLGGSDEKCCTYEKGYIKRQALYSCLTCCPEAKTNEQKAAGICLACCYQCHENHELIELYTKRNFRCDCPTERISLIQCNLIPNSNTNECGSSSSSIATKSKLSINNDNKYNQNFSGVYCTCKRPYPDPDDPIQDEMIQCIICEDWYHTRHLNSSFIPKSDSYSEMICGGCMDAHNILQDYMGLAVNKIENSTAVEDDADEINVTTPGSLNNGDDDKLKSELDKSISDIMSISSKNSAEDSLNIDNESVSNTSCNDGPSCKKMKLDESTEKSCKRPNGKYLYKQGGVFWPENWRKNLCSCSDCIKIYASEKIEFLLDDEDTVQFYEENGMKKVKATSETDYEREMRALSCMDRVAQIEAITEYNKMKEKLMVYLRKFVIEKKVVTEADIHDFFQKMKDEKNNCVGIPHFCR